MALQSFDQNVAVKVGVTAAVVYEKIAARCERSAASGEHFHDGLYWTQGDPSLFASLLTFSSQTEIDEALDKLVRAGLVKTGSYGGRSIEWYAAVGPKGI